MRKREERKRFDVDLAYKKRLLGAGDGCQSTYPQDINFIIAIKKQAEHYCFSLRHSVERLIPNRSAAFV
jgi:hypothetical protein